MDTLPRKNVLMFIGSSIALCVSITWMMMTRLEATMHSEIRQIRAECQHLNQRIDQYVVPRALPAAPRKQDDGAK